jgi:hypothetical protein
MTNPYSEDLRERALARADAGGDGALGCRGAGDQPVLYFQMEEAAARDWGPEARQNERPQEANLVRR